MDDDDTTQDFDDVAVFDDEEQARLEDKKEFAAIVNLRGTIMEQSGKGGPPGGISFKGCKDLVARSFATKGVLCVVLVVNSPGGSPAQTNMLAGFIREMSVEHKVPVYAIVEDMGCSGGFWLACAADEIYLDPNSSVGSIGVITSSLGVVDAMSKVKAKPMIFSTSKHKVGVSPIMPVDAEMEQIIKENLSLIHDNFVKWVKSRRPKLAKEDASSTIFSGRQFLGQEAVKLGLADGCVSTLKELLQKKYPDKELKAIEIKKKGPAGLLGLLGDLFQRGSQVLDDILATVTNGGPQPK